MNAELLAVGETHLAAARIALAVWLILVSTHWIAGAGVFGPDGAMAWRLMPGKGLLGVVRRSMSTRLLRLWIGLQLAIAVALFFAGSPSLACVALLMALVSHGSFIVLIGEHGSSGADKMGLIVLAGTLIGAAGLLTDDSALLLAGCLVSGGQLVICYMVAGVSKLRQPAWRSGAELEGVVAHPVWGAPWAAALLRPRTVAMAVSWALMLGEALFPLALLLPEAWLIAALVVMLGFHLATALIMRLSLFPWAFMTAYPAVLLLGRVVRTTLI